MSMNTGARSHTTIPSQPAGRRSRSTHLPTIHDVSGQNTTTQMSDIERLFDKLSMQQEERHREQTRELREQNLVLQARLDSIEARTLPPSSNPERGGFSAQRGAATQAKRRVLRTLQRGLTPPDPDTLSESDTGPHGVNSTNGGLDADADADDEGGDDRASTTLEKGKIKTAIQVRQPCLLYKAIKCRLEMQHPSVPRCMRREGEGLA